MPKVRKWDYFKPGDMVKTANQTIGVVLRPNKTLAKKVFYQPECIIGDYGVSVNSWQYILIDVQPSLNPGTVYNLGKRYYPMHQLRRVRKPKE